MYDSLGKWIKAYTIGNVFYTLAWGLYFTASRIYVKEVLGGTFTDITLLTSLEFLPALLSTFWVNKATMFSAVLQLAALVIVGLYYLRTRRLKEK